jgi:hypothetical protein
MFADLGLIEISTKQAAIATDALRMVNFSTCSLSGIVCAAPLTRGRPGNKGAAILTERGGDDQPGKVESNPNAILFGEESLGVVERACRATARAFIDSAGLPVARFRGSWRAPLQPARITESTPSELPP